MGKSFKEARGFTLIELLVVISVIGLLAAVVMVSLNSARQKSRNARRVADVRQLMTSFELFYNSNYAYPTATAGFPIFGNGNPEYSTFLATYPIAPTPPDGICSASTNTYTYVQTGGGTGYTLTFCLGAATGGYPAGAHTASQTGIQ